MEDVDLEALKASRREARAQQRRRRGSRRRPARALARDAAALLDLPGPPGWSAEDRELAHDALAARDGHRTASPEEQHESWCADVVARAERARRAGVSVSESDLGVWAEEWGAVVTGAARHRERTARLERFTAWLATAPAGEQAAVERARRERHQVRQGQEHLAALRSGLGAVGQVHAAQLERVAAMAALYRCAEQPRGAHDDDGDRAPDGATSRQRARRGQEELAEGLDALLVEVATSLGWTDTSARRVLATALVATTSMPRAMALLRSGGLQLAQLEVVVERLSEAEAAVAEQVDEVLFGDGGSGVGLTTAELRHEADAVLHRLDAAAVRARAARRVRARDVTFRMLGDGIGELRYTGPAPALAAVHARLTGVAKANLAEARAAHREGRVAADGGDPYADPLAERDPSTGLLPDERGVGAHRFDAGVGALLGVRPASLTDHGVDWTGPTLEVQLSLPGAVGVEDMPGHLEGYGWVPGFLVRQGLSWKGCRLRRVLTDPFTGDLITVDGHTYPASWLTGGDGDSGSARGGGPPPEGGAPASTFRGLPVQHLPPPRTEDDVLGDPLDDDSGWTDSTDPCRDGTCRPLDPDECPAPDGPHDPPAALDRWVRRAWGRCTGPGSTARASEADLDHVVPWREDGSGGPTCSCNLEPKSRRFHLVKHGTDRQTWRNDDDPSAVPWTRRWQQHRCSEGSAHWRSPLGVDHVVRRRRPALPVPRFRPVSWPPAPPAPPLPEVEGRSAPAVADSFPEEPTF